MSLLQPYSRNIYILLNTLPTYLHGQVVKRVEIEIGEIEKDEIKEKKKHRKEYLYAVAVLGVVGLLFAMATGVPIGAQVAVPALSSVAYFFEGGHELNVPQATWYYITHGHWPGYQDWVDALMGVGLSYPMACAIAGILYLLDVISYKTLMAVLLAFLDPAFAIGIVGSLLAF